MKKKIKALSLLLALIIFCFSGCKGSTEESEGKTKKENLSGVKISALGDSTFNPLLIKKKSMQEALSLCYEPLFEINRDISLKGVLGEKCTVSEDAMSAVVSLKKDVKWHDGKSFTSGDVVYTVNFIKEHTESVYSFCVSHIKEARAIDPANVMLVFDRPYGQIGYSLYFPIIPSHKDKLETEITGTGPYKLSEYIPSASFSLVRNESYHNGEVKCENVFVSIVRDRESGVTSFDAKQTNVITTELLDLSNYSVKGDARSSKYPSSKYEFLFFNQQRSIFSTKEMRSAISQALNRQEIASEVYSSLLNVANSPMHPLSRIAPPSPVYVEYNLEGATEMFFYEGYSMNEKTGLLQNEDGKGISFKILVNKENNERMICAELIAKQLALAGINCTPEYVSFEKYEEKIKSGDFDCYLGGVKMGNLYDYEFLLGENDIFSPYVTVSDDMKTSLVALSLAFDDTSIENAVRNFEEVFIREAPIAGIGFLTDTIVSNGDIGGKLMPTLDSPYSSISSWTVK